MSRPYSPLAVLRHLPAELVRRFCDTARTPLAVPWADPPDARTVYAAWQTLPPDPQAKFEQMLQWVHQLGTVPGVRSLTEEAAFRGYNLADRPAEYGLPAAALYCLVAFPPVFHHILTLDTADRLPGRHWHRTPGLPAAPPDASRDTLLRLEYALGTYLRAEQGRGQRVTVEHLVRAGREHYFLCYPDDYTHTHVRHDDRGRLDRVPVRPTFEVVFAFDPAAGVLETYCPGLRAVREWVEGLFVGQVLAAETPTRRPHQPVYELDGLLDPAFAFPTDPADGVRQVRVAKLRVALPDSGRRLVVEGDPAGDPADAVAMLDALLPAAAYPRGRLHVVQATFSLLVRPTDGGRDRPLTFEVAYPNGCSLKSLPADRRELGEKYLKAWGITRDSAPAGGS